MPRSKMPTKPEDFDLKVPDGVIYSISRHVQALAHPLEAFFGAFSMDDACGVAVARDAAEAFAVARDASQSEFWDIELRHRDNPSLQKLYTLEVVPVEEGEVPDGPTTPGTPGTPGTPNTPDASGTSGTPTPSDPIRVPSGLGSDAGTGAGGSLTDTGDGAMDGALALGLLGACFGVLSLVVGLIARSRRA